MEFWRTIFIAGAGNTEVWAPFILRVGFGLALISHGYPKFKTLRQFSGYVASLKVPASKLFAFLAVIVEFFGALLLVAGLFVKPTAIVIAAYFLLVILLAHRGQKFQQGWELAYLYLVGALALWAMNSSGVFALDTLLNP